MGHYSKGSEKPAFKGDRLRLYSMRFCPFAQRARLVLAAKGIEYECVNINLRDKPEWFVDMTPSGAVPVIEHPDGKVIYESLIVADYLDELFPETQLYPGDPFKKSTQRIVVETIGRAFITSFHKALSAPGDEEPKEGMKKQLSAFDNYLKNNDKHLGAWSEDKLNKKFLVAENFAELVFKGDKPGMGDFLLWPFLERFLLFQSRVGLDVTQFPAVSAWCTAMKEVPAVKESSYPEEMYLKYFDRYHKDGDPDAQLIGIDQKP